MLKITGSLFVIAACTGFGMAKAAELQRRIAALRHLKRLLLLLRGEIQYAKTPFQEAFVSIAEKENGDFQLFCRWLAEELAKMDGRSFQQIWEEAITTSFSESGFAKEDLQQLIQMGVRLGYLDYQMQLATIDLQIEQMENLLLTLEGAFAEKQRIYRCVGAFCGLLIAILFI